MEDRTMNDFTTPWGDPPWTPGYRVLTFFAAMVIAVLLALCVLYYFWYAVVTNKKAMGLLE
jgi:hypothetical protein